MRQIGQLWVVYSFKITEVRVRKKNIRKLKSQSLWITVVRDYNNLSLEILKEGIQTQKQKS